MKRATLQEMPEKEFAELKRLPQIDGVLPIIKPAGPTSAHCLTALKRQGQKKTGHAGTLDPLAAGVLIVLLGQATKLAGYLNSNGKKTYLGKLRLGLETDTWDMEGQPVKESAFQHIAHKDAEGQIAAWTDLTLQEVPAYSAARYNGQQLYKLARKGQYVPVKIKPVKIYETELLAFDLPYATFRVTCGSGTYIRSLAHSLGVRLGCGACLCELTREYSYPFDLTQSCPWEEILSGAWTKYVKTLSQALPNWPVIEINEQWAAKVRNGMAVPAVTGQGNAFLACQGQPLAIVRYNSGFWVIERGLWNN